MLICGWLTSRHFGSAQIAAWSWGRKCPVEKRFVSSEWNKIIAYASYLSELSYMRDDMQSRLSMVENGPDRLNKLIEDAGSLLRDILDTGTENQKRKLRNTFHDFKMVLTPMMSPGTTNVLMTKDQAKELVDLAQEKCKNCIEDAEAAEKCPVFKVMEVTTPLNRYDSMICPFSLAQWSDD